MMAQKLQPHDRLVLIRKGNELFNSGQIEKAARIFVATAYKDGLIRVGDYYYFDMKNPLKALHYYMEAQYKKRIRELAERMAVVVKRWMTEDQRAERTERVNDKTTKVT